MATRIRLTRHGSKKPRFIAWLQPRPRRRVTAASSSSSATTIPTREPAIINPSRQDRDLGAAARCRPRPSPA